MILKPSILLPLLLFLAPALTLRAQINDSLEVVGVHFFPEQLSDTSHALRQRLRSDRDGTTEFIRSLYFSQGFWNAEVEVDLTEDGGTRLTVIEGVRYEIGQITIDLSGKPDVDIVPLHSALQTFYGLPYSDSLVSRTMRTLTGILADSGFVLARVSPGPFRVDSNGTAIELTFRIDPMERVGIGGINFQGNRKTSSSFLRNALSIDSGQIFTRELNRTIRSRLEQLDLFSHISEPQIVINDSGNYELLIELEERDVNIFDGVLGYQPGSENETGFLTGLIRVSLRNLFGGGERISGRWEKAGRTTSFLELGFSRQRLFGLPLGANLAFEQRQESETTQYTPWIERSFTGGVSWQISDHWQILGGGSLSGVLPAPDSLNGPCSTRQLPSSSSLSLQLGSQFDTRSSRYNPLHGILFRAMYKGGFKSVNERSGCPENMVAGRFARNAVNTEFDFYHQISGPLVIAAELSFSETIGERLDESELYRLGGFQSVRGYREGQFRGSRVGTGRGELRLILSELSFAALFVDLGYYRRPDDLTGTAGSSEDFVPGYGVALQVDTPVGIARFSFGLGRGDAIEEGKVSFGLIGEF